MLVLVMLYTGVATPTEIGALGALLAAVIGAVFGRLTCAGRHRRAEVRPSAPRR